MWKNCNLDLDECDWRIWEEDSPHDFEFESHGTCRTVVGKQFGWRTL